MYTSLFLHAGGLWKSSLMIALDDMFEIIGNNLDMNYIVLIIVLQIIW